MCGNWKPIKAWAHAHTQKTLPQTLDRHPPFTCKMISAGVRVTQRNTWDRVVGFPCFRRTNVGNKVPINVPACQVNNAWSRVNNWSHTSYTFSSSLCWIIEGGIVIFWGTSGFSPPRSRWRCFTFPSVGYNKEPSVWNYRAPPSWAELHHCRSHNRPDLWTGAGQIR